MLDAAKKLSLKFSALSLLLASGSLALANSDNTSTGMVETMEANTALVQQRNSSGQGHGHCYMQVHVDDSYCANGGVQCDTFAKPASVNGNNIRLLIQVTNRKGRGITGLTSENFSVSNSFVPAGGTSIGASGCVHCFQEGSEGVYALFVDPVSDANWSKGGYGLSLKLDCPARYGNKEIDSLTYIEIES